MEVIPTQLQGVVRLRPRVIRDERGFFLESWNQLEFDRAIGRPVGFVQDNLCSSRRGVLRGLHYQVAPMAQGKLVSVVSGQIFDVAVDLREGSPTRLKWVAALIDAESREMMWVPEGFAHGFLVLSEFAEVSYKATAFFSREHERSVRWDDPSLGIQWPVQPGDLPLLSPRDAAAPLL